MRHANKVLAALAVLSLLLAVYVAGYLWLGERLDWRAGLIRISNAPGKRVTRLPEIIRTYPYQWLATAFKPAGRIEQRLIGRLVDVQAKGERPDIWVEDIARR
jgi:hypothetical protein